MHEASATRSQDAADRARRALRELAKQGVEVNFARVAAAAGVTRQFLYAHAMLRAEIERLRDQQRALARLPVADRSSDASIRSRLRAALDDNQRCASRSPGCVRSWRSHMAGCASWSLIAGRAAGRSAAAPKQHQELDKQRHQV